MLVLLARTTETRVTAPFVALGFPVERAPLPRHLARPGSPFTPRRHSPMAELEMNDDSPILRAAHISEAEWETARAKLDDFFYRLDEAEHTITRLCMWIIFLLLIDAALFLIWLLK